MPVSGMSLHGAATDDTTALTKSEEAQRSALQLAQRPLLPELNGKLRSWLRLQLSALSRKRLDAMLMACMGAIQFESGQAEPYYIEIPDILGF